MLHRALSGGSRDRWILEGDRPVSEDSLGENYRTKFYSGVFLVSIFIIKQKREDSRIAEWRTFLWNLPWFCVKIQIKMCLG